jgi:anthranilate phosphoribosyltransferase
VVHGTDGLDEITTTTSTWISEIDHGKFKNYEIVPEDFAMQRAKPQDLLGAGTSENAKILLDILNGREGPKRDIVILNSAAAIYAADKARSIEEGIALAKESIDSKKALEKLELLKDYSKK